MVIDAAQSFLPEIADEQLQDGTYWSVTLIALPYVFFLSYIMLPANITLSSNEERLKWLIVLIWFVAVIINYGLIVRKRRWRKILNRLNEYTIQKKEAFAALTQLDWCVI